MQQEEPQQTGHPQSFGIPHAERLRLQQHAEKLRTWRYRLKSELFHINGMWSVLAGEEFTDEDRRFGERERTRAENQWRIVNLRPSPEHSLFDVYDAVDDGFPSAFGRNPETAEWDPKQLRTVLDWIVALAFVGAPHIHRDARLKVPAGKVMADIRRDLYSWAVEARFPKLAWPGSSVSKRLRLAVDLVACADRLPSPHADVVDSVLVLSAVKEASRLLMKSKNDGVFDRMDYGYCIDEKIDDALRHCADGENDARVVLERSYLKVFFNVVRDWRWMWATGYSGPIATHAPWYFDTPENFATVETARGVGQKLEGLALAFEAVALRDYASFLGSKEQADDDWMEWTRVTRVERLQRLRALVGRSDPMAILQEDARFGLISTPPLSGVAVGQPTDESMPDFKNPTAREIYLYVQEHGPVSGKDVAKAVNRALNTVSKILTGKGELAPHVENRGGYRLKIQKST